MSEEVPDEKPVLTKKEKTKADKQAEHIAQGVYQVTLAKEVIAGADFEYFVALPEEDTIRFPATAPALNQSVVIF